MSKLALQPRPTRGHATRSRLVEVAIAEFKRVGVEQANIGKIALKAGVSRPAFYFHFPTKAHILLELLRSLEMPMAAEVAACTTLDEVLDVFVSGLMRARKQVGDHQLFSDMLLIYTRNTSDLPIVDQPLMAVLAEKLKKAAATGRLRKDMEPEQATLLFLTSVFGFMIGQGNICNDKECEKALNQLAALFLK